ncbi:hypothetical protein ACQV5M_20420, partial [Leptospira sp. SA-E8]|uniref:hypothetical protein n=1 Tax=Leptospira sp. SA-E8 TaxID=3422259 RepID=UPI003EB82DB8
MARHPCFLRFLAHAAQTGQGGERGQRAGAAQGLARGAPEFGGELRAGQLQLVRRQKPQGRVRGQQGLRELQGGEVAGGCHRVSGLGLGHGRSASLPRISAPMLPPKPM